MTCDQSIASSDAICQCGASIAASDGAGSNDNDNGDSSAESNGNDNEDSSGGDLVCDEEAWPDKDHDLVCGECKVLVNNFNTVYQTCDGYCATVGRQCAGAWEEELDTCNVLYEMTCDQSIASSDAICQCGEQVSTINDGSGAHDGGAGSGSEGGDASDEGTEVCYGEFAQRAVDEGNGIGAPEIVTSSDGTCKDSCSGNDQCKSFTYCPSWNKCWLKDRSFSGSARPEVKVVSYNLFWWNAHNQNPWKFQSIADNIKDTLQADTLGLQECDSASVIRDRTGYEAASPFEGAQGVVVHPGRFRVGRTGARDIQATGKWGPRYVTWAELTDLGSDRTFWHFNTHWCVHNGNGRTCNSDVRYTGAQHMLDAIRQEAGSAPVVITGDFNAAMGEAGPQHFLANGFELAGSNWVDAIFYTKEHWEVISTSTGNPANSDHAPVIATLKMK